MTWEPHPLHFKAVFQHAQIGSGHVLASPLNHVSLPTSIVVSRLSPCYVGSVSEYDSYRSDAPPTYGEKRVQQLAALLEERERESGRSLRALQQKYNAMEVSGSAHCNPCTKRYSRDLPRALLEVVIFQYFQQFWEEKVKFKLNFQPGVVVGADYSQPVWAVFDIPYRRFWLISILVWAYGSNSTDLCAC